MTQLYPYPPMPDASTSAALEITAGDRVAAAMWGFMFSALWQAVDIDGIKYSLQFATPTLIPVTPGPHNVTCFMYSGTGFSKGRPTMQNSTQVQVAAGSVLPISYRQHRTTFGALTNFKQTVLKVGMPRQFILGMNGYSEQQPQPMHQYAAQHQQPSPQYTPRAGEAGSGFDSPFTDSQPASKSIGKKFCTKCGTEIAAGNRFCGGCGQQVVS